jgi:hypothetical protein
MLEEAAVHQHQVVARSAAVGGSFHSRPAGSRPSTATWIGGPVEGGDGISGRVHNLGTASHLRCLDRGLHPNRPFGAGHGRWIVTGGTQG